MWVNEPAQLKSSVFRPLSFRSLRLSLYWAASWRDSSLSGCLFEQRWSAADLPCVLCLAFHLHWSILTEEQHLCTAWGKYRKACSGFGGLRNKIVNQWLTALNSMETHLLHSKNLFQHSQILSRVNSRREVMEIDATEKAALFFKRFSNNGCQKVCLFSDHWRID